MKKSSFLLLVLTLLTGCASFQLSTLNHDPVYSIEGSDTEVKVIKNEFELARLLRNDFNFRYDFAQYALSQPESFDWRFNRMSRFMGMHRYGYNQHSIFGTNTWGYSNMWNRSQMWNDWVWGYPYGNGIGWSYSWNNNRWSSNSWNGWGNGYGYNAWHHLGGIYGRQQNVANVSGRRMSSSNRRGIAAMGNSRIVNTKVTKPRIRRIVKPKPIRVIKPRRNNTVIPRRNNTSIPRNTRTVVTRRTNTTRVVNSRRKN
jgi:hypothetical protein